MSELENNMLCFFLITIEWIQRRGNYNIGEKSINCSGIVKTEG